MKPEMALAASLIGKPWAVGAAGPDAFNCWGLVRYWMRQTQGLDMADIAIAVESDQAPAVIAAARAGGWRPVAADSALAGDIAMMRNSGNDGRHVGVLLRANSALCLLHCEGSEADPTPGVLCEPLETVLRRYHGLELWRRA